MQRKFVIEALKRLQDALYVIEENTARLPYSAAGLAIQAIAKAAWTDAHGLLTEFERDEEKAADTQKEE